MEADENTDEDNVRKPLQSRSFNKTNESDEKPKTPVSQEFNIQELSEEDEDDKSLKILLPQKKITELGPSQEVSRDNTPTKKRDSDSRLMNMQLGGI